MHSARPRVYINLEIRKNIGFHEYEFDASTVQTVHQ